MPDELYRVLALDYGSRRIGVAMSDEMRMLASARGVLANSPRVLEEILQLCARENIRKVVLGLPKTLGNRDSAMTAEVRKFGERLQVKLEERGIGLDLRDERLTSIMAGSNIAASELPKSRRETKGLRDEEAARILLQEYLDQKF